MLVLNNGARWHDLRAWAMGAAFPDAHDAAADVKMTVAVMRWAYAEAHKRARA